MTNQDIGNFLSSIAEAKRAFDAEPGYRSDITRLTNRCEELGETISRRELHIHDLKGEVSSLTSKLREVEAERDDAGFRCLEETDKVQGLLTLVHGFIGDALKAVHAVDGEGPYVVVTDTERQELLNLRLDASHELERNAGLERRCKELEAERDEAVKDRDGAHRSLFNLQAEMRMAQEQLAPRPFGASITPDGGTGSFSGGTKSSPSERHDMFPEPEYYGKVQDSAAPISAYAGDGQVSPGEGQSDGPFAKADTTLTTQSETVYSQPVPIAESVPSPASPPERNRDPLTRFKGRKYYDVTYYVPYHEWIAGGGTEADYHWRPDYGVNRASHQS